MAGVNVSSKIFNKIHYSTRNLYECVGKALKIKLYGRFYSMIPFWFSRSKMQILNEDLKMK